MTRQRAGARAAVAWARCAATLAEAVPRARLHPRVLAWAAASSRRATWSVAFSGGADSLCLLLLLWAHWPERRARLRALHFDHRLRGAESRQDALFCRRVCRALGVTLIEGAWKDVPADANEAQARDARHAFFDRHASALWCGHQQDDIAETLFMRLARGSGSGGLAAPRPVHALPRRRVHLRPLLTLKKCEITAALQAAGADWREDSSNVATHFFRNRIRRNVLPAWQKAAGRDALAGAAWSRELIEEDDEALSAWVDALQPVAADGSLNLRRLAGKPRAVVRRALHRWLLRQPEEIRISRVAFEALLAAAMRGNPTRHSLGCEKFAVVGGGRMRAVQRKNQR